MEQVNDPNQAKPGPPREADKYTTIVHQKDASYSSSPSSHRRSVSGAGLLSKLSFMRPTTSDAKLRHEGDNEEAPSQSSPRVMATVVQQQKSRRRTGSLRKVALLGRGAQRDRRDAKQLTIDTSHAAGHEAEQPSQAQDPSPEHSALGLVLPDAAMRKSSLGDFASATSRPSTSPPKAPEGEHIIASPTRSANSTTDEDDLPHMSSHSARAPRPDSDPSLSSGSESYFGGRTGPQTLRQRSPLAYSGIANTPIPADDSDWDYSDTEWWGWVVLAVTWVVFVVGMGSCLGVWSWAWDVGTTPYAPPELEDDPTLPIVGYYPALIILTCIMAWVWVVVAWVGMKYFRHAKISGD